MAKPKKPFMVMNGNDFATFKKGRIQGEIIWDNWDGTHFATEEEAQAMIDDYAMEGSEIIEVLEEIRTTIRL